ncbi:hypothetical protein FOMA001_g11668 [Fusarium oxysporum f. sp. matthiolae]|nr:hypothetical protein FOMA001_g11668 [Fusarium oxysporum f. sp. matthiolae]
MYAYGAFAQRLKAQGVHPRVPACRGDFGTWRWRVSECACAPCKIQYGDRIVCITDSSKHLSSLTLRKRLKESIHLPKALIFNLNCLMPRGGYGSLMIRDCPRTWYSFAGAGFANWSFAVTFHFLFPTAVARLNDWSSPPN